MLKEGEVLRDTVGSRVTEYWNRGVCYRRAGSAATVGTMRPVFMKGDFLEMS